VTRIIKLGGSVITHDDPKDPFDAKNTARLAGELAPFARGTILTHGTGFVGKPFANEHDFVHNGLLTADRKLLAAKIRNSLRRLNVAVVDALRHAGIPAYGVQPSVFFDEHMRDLRFPEFEQAMLQQMRSGHVPVFFGDLMPLANGDFQVFSSDRMTAILARKLNPQSVIFLSDVAGVFGSDADGQRRSQPLACIKPDTLDEIFVDVGDGSDVSGGMRGKVELALSAAKHSGRCVIANGLEHGLLAKLLSGDSVPCTEVCAV
jgi:isopentenyl phosphate kinase